MEHKNHFLHKKVIVLHTLSKIYLIFVQFFDSTINLYKMYVKRILNKELSDMASQYPVVMITGPRQSGKTTLSKQAFSEKPYYSLENPDTRAIISSDPKAFFASNPNGAVIDEFQRYPEILSYVQGIVDERKQKGMFVLTGSNNVNMLSKISQSLAGRVAILTLLPFSIKEIAQEYSTDEFLLNGFYPAIYADQLNPTKAYRNYYETYIERDVRQLINIKDIYSFQKFMKLCAGRTGQLFNASSLATEVGVSMSSIQAWLSALQAMYILFLVQPWYANLNKRVVKTPKLYFYDVGLSCYLMGIENITHIATHPLRGSLFENMVVVELLKKRYNTGMDNNLYFYRDNHGNEVDIVQENGYQIDLFEIKSAQTFTPHFLKGLNYFRKISPNNVGKSHLIFDGTDDITINNHNILNFRKI
jgi:uncharacterized protein